MTRRVPLLFLFFFALLFAPVHAQEEGIADAIAKITQNVAQQEGAATAPSLKGVAAGTSEEPNLITMMAVITLVALLPYAIILLTSFLKIVIVLSLLRNALGVQQAPPNQVLTGIAILMSIYVMFPTCVAMYNSGKDYIVNEAPKELFSKSSALYVYNVVDKTKEPLKKFLMLNGLIKQKMC